MPPPRPKTLYPKRETLGGPAEFSEGGFGQGPNGGIIPFPPTPNVVVVTNNVGEIIPFPPISTTEVFYLDNARSNIQAQIDAITALLSAPGFSQPWTSLAVAPGAETGALFTYTVPALKKFLIDKVSFTGRSDALMRLKVDLVPIDFCQINWTSRFGELTYPNSGSEVAAGSTITVTVHNLGETSADYYGNVFGRLLDV